MSLYLDVWGTVNDLCHLNKYILFESGIKLKLHFI